MMVSILIPCFNAERWVAEAIESALGQTWPYTEVIVVDDGSTDDSLSIIKSFSDRIRFESGPNRGGNAARNRLLHLARGSWLQYLDADDYLLPTKIERQISVAIENPTFDILYSASLIECITGPKLESFVLEIPSPADPWIRLARWYLPQTGATLWRRDAILSVGGWREDQPCCQEHELYLRLLMAGKAFSTCDDVGAVYRQWSEETVSKRNKPETYRQRLIIEDAAEAHLRSVGELTVERLTAINQARFELARLIWQYDPAKALSIMETVSKKQPQFSPTGHAAPPTYQAAYRWLGFRLAERFADFRRSHAGFRHANQQ